MLRQFDQALLRTGDWIESWMPEGLTDGKCLFLILTCGFWLLIGL